MTRDPRWILLAENGDCSIVGRHREPDPDDVARFETALADRGLGGWLAVASNSFHSRIFPEILRERVLGDPKASFEEAVAALRQRMEEPAADEEKDR